MLDVFGSVVVASQYRPHAPDEEQALADWVRDAGIFQALYLKRRPQEARHRANIAPDEVAPKSAFWGMSVESVTVEEQGVAFDIRPGNGLSVGLYLDARDARRFVREHARGHNVLNLFAYTCGFGLAASLGGARRAVNVDSSRKVLDWGQANYRLNALVPSPKDFIAADAFDFLKLGQKKGDLFDFVVLDPPSFATTKKSRFSAAKDYGALVASALGVCAPKATLLTCCNLETMSGPTFRQLVLDRCRAKNPSVVAQFGASSIDFKQPSALKVIALRLGQ